MKSNWIISDPAKGMVPEVAEIFQLNPYLACVLYSRGIDSPLKAYRYLSPRLSSMHSPYLMKDMDLAVSRIRSAAENDERIGIFADSDLDGLTSLTLILRLLQKIGLKSVPYYRYPVESDDYGLSKALIDDNLERGVKLLITLDSGIRDIGEIAYAREKGMDVIVCDHHEEGKVLPDAIIINPKRSGCDYPFKELAGVGVAFKLSHGILLSYLQRYNKRIILVTGDAGALYVSHIRNWVILTIEKLDGPGAASRIAAENDDVFILCDAGEAGDEILCIFGPHRVHDLYAMVQSQAGAGNNGKLRTIDQLCSHYDINPLAFEKKIDIVNEIFLEYEYSVSPKLGKFCDSVIDLVALGTIADIMPVRDENRTLIHFGLKSLGRTSHPGLRLLLESGDYALTSKSVAWNIAPLLNTPGRLGKTGLTAGFFLDSDEKNLKSILVQLNRLNEERKHMLSDLFEMLYARAAGGEFISGKNLVFVDDARIPEGLCGLVANRLADALGKPVIAISLLSGKNVVKGSGRSKGGFNFFSCVEPFSPLFEKIGGHAQAFGFSARLENLQEIRGKISDYLDAHADSFPRQAFYIDLDLPIESVDLELIHEISRFEPFGNRNEELLFLSRDVQIREFYRIGSDKNHGKYLFRGNPRLEAVGWNMADVMEKKLPDGRADIIYHLERNEFNGQSTAQMRIVDIG